MAALKAKTTKRDQGSSIQHVQPIGEVASPSLSRGFGGSLVVAFWDNAVDLG